MQVCQLTELKQTKGWERHLCETLLPENFGKRCPQWPALKQIQKSNFSFNKLADRRISQCTLMARSSKTSNGEAPLLSKMRPPSTKTVPF